MALGTISHNPYCHNDSSHQKTLACSLQSYVLCCRNDLYFQIIPVCYIHLSYSLYLPPDKCFLDHFTLASLLPLSDNHILAKQVYKNPHNQPDSSVHIVLNPALQVLFILLSYIFRFDNPHTGSDTGNPSKELRAYRHWHSGSEMLIILRCSFSLAF